MSKLLLTFSLLCLGLAAGAQQKPQYTQYMANGYLLNPAISGIEDYADVKLGYRNQWVGFEGAPVTFYASAHTPLGRRPADSLAGPANRRPGPARAGYPSGGPRHGIGAIALLDQVGPLSRTEVALTYAYHVRLAENLRLSAGVSAGLLQYVFRTDKLRLADPNDPLSGSTTRDLKPDFAAGLWLYADKYYLGASATQLLGNRFSFGGDGTGDPSRLYRHYFLTAGYKLTPGEKFTLIPSVLVKWVRPVAAAVDCNLRLNYAGRLWAGASWRQHEGFAGLVGATFSHVVDVGYSYDLGMTGVGQLAGGSHEIILGLRLGNRSRVLSPRHLW